MTIFTLSVTLNNEEMYTYLCGTSGVKSKVDFVYEVNGILKSEKGCNFDHKNENGDFGEKVYYVIIYIFMWFFDRVRFLGMGMTKRQPKFKVFFFWIKYA